MSQIPIKLLHEAVGFKVTVELVSGDCYNGVLSCVEDHMNLNLSNVTHTDVENNVTNAETVFIRGTNILTIQIPDMLINCSLFENSKEQVKQKFSSKIKRKYMTVKQKKPTRNESEWSELFHNPEFLQIFE